MKSKRSAPGRKTRATVTGIRRNAFDKALGLPPGTERDKLLEWAGTAAAARLALQGQPSAAARPEDIEEKLREMQKLPEAWSTTPQALGDVALQGHDAAVGRSSDAEAVPDPRRTFEFWADMIPKAQPAGSAGGFQGETTQ